MCELMAMSATLPTDISFSLTGFVRRGGDTGPHKDGFGICFYEGKAIREFKDHLPGAHSKVVSFLQGYAIQSNLVIAHIRQANVGGISLENTHPFQREMNGRIWTFAHNGQMLIADLPCFSRFQPIGETDSEHIFCWLLDQISQSPIPEKTILSHASWLANLCHSIHQYGVSNILLSDGLSLFVFCSTHLSWITRKAPFRQAHLMDADWTIDFAKKTSAHNEVTVIATRPLTDNEPWVLMRSGECRIFQLGQSKWMTYRQPIIHPATPNP